MEQGSTSHSTSDYKRSRSRRKYEVFLSHSGAQKGFVEQLCVDLERCDRPPFFDKRCYSLPFGIHFPRLIFEALEQCEVGVVVLSEEFFTSKWPMLELVAMANVKKRKPSFTIMPILLGLSHSQLQDEHNLEEWSSLWRGWAECDSRINYQDWLGALRYLGRINALKYNSVLGEVKFREEIVKAICSEVQSGTWFEDSHVQKRSRLCEGGGTGIPIVVDFSNTLDLFHIGTILRGINESQERLFRTVQQCTVFITRIDGSFIGSGFIFSSGPYIFTCAHVVFGLDRCRITSMDGPRKVQGIVNVVYRSKVSDVAILKAKESFKYFLLRCDSSLSGGVGYVFGYDADLVLKMSLGVTSEGSMSEAFIACHADHGYSGAPVTDYKGTVKGMVVGSKGIALHTIRYVTANCLDDAAKDFENSSSPICTW